MGFCRKSQRAQFHTEWQTRLDEDYYAKRQRQQREQQRHQQQQQRWKTLVDRSAAAQSQNHTKTTTNHQNSLRRLIEQRQYWDRVEDRNWLFSQSPFPQTRLARSTDNTRPQNNNTSALSPPGWLVYRTTTTDEVDVFAREYSIDTDRIPTLQALSLHVLAHSLWHYLDALGPDVLHQYLGFLPARALTVLSVQSSKLGWMTHDLCRALGRHRHVTRFSLVACARLRCDDETDPNWKDLQPNRALRGTFLTKVAVEEEEEDSNDTATELSSCKKDLETLRIQTHVPDSWEDLFEEEDDSITHDANPLYPSVDTPAWSGCWALERLELGRFPLLDVDLLQQVLKVCPMLTHLGLSGSLTYDRGPDVLWNLSEWVPRLQVLDVSGNAGWVTEPLLRSVYESYQALRTGGGAVFSADPDRDEECDNPQQPDGQQQRYQHILIKATGCLVRSSQLLLEAEFGTLF